MEPQQRMALEMAYHAFENGKTEMNTTALLYALLYPP